MAVAVNDDRLGVAIEIHGLRGMLDTISLEDVVGAARGSMTIARPASGTLRIQAELPCA